MRFDVKLPPLGTVVVRQVGCQVTVTLTVMGFTRTIEMLPAQALDMAVALDTCAAEANAQIAGGA